ncbi:MAG: serine protease [Clostridia bacterium]|nr:serine protease [Clostridia bacterium]
MKFVKKFFTLILVVVLSINFIACSQSDNNPSSKLTAEQVYSIGENCVGEVITYTKSGIALSLGTAFVIDKHGKLVTNYHVIEDGYSAKITLGTTTYEVTKVLAHDVDIDLAVLQVNALNLTPAIIQTENVTGGMQVYAMGSSEGYTLSFSSGVVASPERVFDGVKYIQHNAAISHGNSGGPLFNEYGEVVGINTATDVSGQNLNFAISCVELDNLNYGVSYTMQELYNKYNKPVGTDVFTTLKNYAMTYGVYDYEDDDYEVAFTNYNDGYRYVHTLTYNYTDKEITFSLFMQSLSDGSAFMVFLYIDAVDGYYEWSWVDGYSDYMSGNITASSWTTDSLLAISYYDMATSLLSSARNIASVMMTVMLTYIEINFSSIGISAYHLGFNFFY